MSKIQIGRYAEKLVYRIAGLPVAVRSLLSTERRPADPITATVVNTYWKPATAGDWVRIAAAILLWPVALLFASLWYTARNGAIIKRREGTAIATQLLDQVRVYFSYGVLPPWYYAFSLYRDRARNAATFIQRYETSFGVYPRLKGDALSPLNDKQAFADLCAVHQVRCVPYLACAHDGKIDWSNGFQSLPPVDMFVKPARGRGGKGAQRWDRTPAGAYANGDGEELSAEDLLDHLRQRSHSGPPLLVQPRLGLHPALAALSSGALSTARVMTCLDGGNAPQVVAAVFRMSIGGNRTVDNIHAGGIASPVDLETGALGPASNLGFDERVGWLTHHPATGAAIKGTVLPLWEEVRRTASSAHSVFADRILIGWDIAITDGGVVVVEGNSSPCVDLIQRPLRRGLRDRRLGELISYHLQRSGSSAP